METFADILGSLAALVVAVAFLKLASAIERFASPNQQKVSER